MSFITHIDKFFHNSLRCTRRRGHSSFMPLFHAWRTIQQRPSSPGLSFLFPFFMRRPRHGNQLLTQHLGRAASRRKSRLLLDHGGPCSRGLHLRTSLFCSPFSRMANHAAEAPSPGLSSFIFLLYPDTFGCSPPKIRPPQNTVFCRIQPAYLFCPCCIPFQNHTLRRLSVSLAVS